MSRNNYDQPTPPDPVLAADLELARRTALALFERLRPDLGSAFEIVKGDPRWFAKHKPGFVRLRLQPVSPQPKNFWNKDWCLYAIKVGPWADIGAQLGAVMFGMYPNNDECGGDHYTRAVREILGRLQPKDSSEFFFNPAAGGKHNALFCGFSYKFRHKTFPAGRRGGDGHRCQASSRDRMGRQATCSRRDPESPRSHRPAVGRNASATA